MIFRSYMRAFLMLMVVILSTNLSADEANMLYEELIDRKVSENKIISKFSITSISSEKLNKVFISERSISDSILRISVYRSFRKVVEAVLEAGADPNIELRNNCSPLGIAIMNGDDDIAKALVSHGADTRIPVCWPQDGSRVTPIDIAITQYEISDATRLMIMREHVSVGEPLSQRVLLFAIVNEKPEIAREFVKLMPEYRNQKLLRLSENRSEIINRILIEAWSKD